MIPLSFLFWTNTMHRFNQFKPITYHVVYHSQVYINFLLIWHLNLNAYCEGSQRENNCKHDNLKSKRHTLIKHTWLRNNNALHRDYNTPEILSWTNICISIKLHYFSTSGVTHGFVTLLWWWSLQFLMNPTAVTQGFCFITPCRSNHAGFLDG